MESRIGVLLIVMAFAAVMSAPMLDAETADSEVFTYYDQLSDDEKSVYKEVYKATAVDETEKSFVIQLDGKTLFDDEKQASEYADRTVNNALRSLYLSTAMVPYIWGYPATELTVEAATKVVTVQAGESREPYYVVDSVTFNLSVPEGITSTSMDDLNTAIAAISVTGGTPAEKVTSIMNNLNSISFKKDEEGQVSSIYDALVLKKTSSAGVAQAFMQLCKLSGIMSSVVSGTNVIATNEGTSYWNYVYLEGDIEGETKYAWYIVDCSYCNSVGIAGYMTGLEYDSQQVSMVAVHMADTDLSFPMLNKGKYVKVGGPGFFELYGEEILLIILAVILAGAMVYAVRTGNF